MKGSDKAVLQCCVLGRFVHISEVFLFTVLLCVIQSSFLMTGEHVCAFDEWIPGETCW